MKYLLLAWLGLFSAQAAVAADSPPQFAESGVVFLKEHCIDCHSGDDPEAGLSLTAFTTNASLIPKRTKWDAVLRMVETGVMPPVDAKQPSTEQRVDFVKLVRSIFAEYDRTAPPDPGRITMRRLNRREYANTVRDLLGVDFDPTANFPADDVGHGFDNIGDVLTLSPLLMERYLDAAETISRRVIVVDPPKPSKRYLAGRYLQPGGSTVNDRFRPLDPTSEEPKVSGPLTGPGSYMKFADDADLYFRATLYAETDSKEPVKVALFVSGAKLEEVSTEAELAPLMGKNRGVLKTAKLLKVFDITARKPEEKQTIEFLVSGNGAIQNAGIAVVQPPEGQKPAILRIEHLWSEGPLETRPASQLMLLATSPDKPEAEQHVEVISRLLRRAFRRTPTPAEVERLVGFAEAAIAGGDKWELAVQKVIQIVLCSPKFLFRVELDDRPTNPKPRPIDSFHLASRLAYFLWSSMPDDELLDLAEKGQLRANLEPQVVRMLADEKSSEFVRSFARQWLQIGRLEQFSPDAKLFPTFSEVLRAAMLKETELFFTTVVREDRSILDLIDADFTFLNAPLAKHYGIADTNGNWMGQKPEQPKGSPIRGNDFVRVSIPHDLRGGLLTQASVLTVTSNPTRTSPVKRGKWVLEQLLGAPPPPPPPNVPELESDDRELTGTLREQMEQHRANPSCAACHSAMDPLGFAFENYNAIGAWRTKDGEHDINAAGELPDGQKFSGPAGLKEVLLARKDDFTRCLAEKMLIYALGRGLEYYDQPTLARIAKRVADNDYRFSSLVVEIVKSEPFVNRRGFGVSK
jgi:mono/diheme cytochrome c family protein